MVFWSTFLSFGLMHGLFLATALALRPAENTRARWLLVGLLLVLSLVLGESLIALHGWWMLAPSIIFATGPLWLTAPPLLYFYVRQRLTGPFSFLSRDLLHLAPLLVALFVVFIPFWNQPSVARTDFVSHAPSGWRWHAFHAVVLIQWTAYGLTAWRLSLKHAAPGVVQLLIGIMATYIVMAGPAWFLPGTVLGAFLNQVDYILVLTLITHAVAWTALMEPDALFARASSLSSQTINGSTKYERSRVDIDRQEALVIRLKQAMTDKKLYLNPTLSLSVLADEVNASPHHVSQALNQGLGRTFHMFVNDYRVAEARRRLLSPTCTHLTILAIAEESGFNSKASFNRAFKAVTGCTPSRYRDTYSESTVSTRRGTG